MNSGEKILKDNLNPSEFVKKKRKNKPKQLTNTKNSILAADGEIATKPKRKRRYRKRNKSQKVEGIEKTEEQVLEAGSSQCSEDTTTKIRFAHCNLDVHIENLDGDNLIPAKFIDSRAKADGFITVEPRRHKQNNINSLLVNKVQKTVGKQNNTQKVTSNRPKTSAAELKEKSSQKDVEKIKPLIGKSKSNITTSNITGTKPIPRNTVITGSPTRNISSNVQGLKPAENSKQNPAPKNLLSTGSPKKNITSPTISPKRVTLLSGVQTTKSIEKPIQSPKKLTPKRDIPNDKIKSQTISSPTRNLNRISTESKVQSSKPTKALKVISESSTRNVPLLAAQNSKLLMKETKQKSPIPSSKLKPLEISKETKIENTAELSPEHNKIPEEIKNSQQNTTKHAEVILSPKPDKLNIQEIKMNDPQIEKSRDEVKAAREAKKLAKQNAKKKLNDQKPSQKDGKTQEIPSNVEVNNILPENKIPIKDVNKKPQEVLQKKEILAEKEVKNLEKHISKNKSKDKTDFQDKNGDCEETESIVEISDELEHLHISETAENKPKNKVTTKAERRAIQEAQRAAKAKSIIDKQKPKVDIKNSTKLSPTSLKIDKIKSETQKTEQNSDKPKECKVKLFNHLYGEDKELNMLINNPTIHPAMVQLGEQYAKRTVVGSNARCIAFLNALKKVIQDYETPPKKEFARGLEASIKNCVDHLQKCRPLAVSINNAHKYIKFVLTQLPTDQPESELKEHLFEFIDTYIRDQIEKAAQAISISVQEKISNGDVLLTFGCSSLINHILEEAHRRHVDFRVILVDSRPFLEGQELLRRLISKGISCTCVLINAVGFIMPEVTKVLLGAHALLANGYVMARTGTAQVALVARSFNVPVLVCCETHKFSERVQTDAIVYNELGNPNDLIIKKSLSKDNRLNNWQSFRKLCPLNLNYDVTPPELVTAVVTEVSILPCTSVPVILRIKPTEIGY